MPTIYLGGFYVKGCLQNNTKTTTLPGHACLTLGKASAGAALAVAYSLEVFCRVGTVSCLTVINEDMVSKNS